jgi:uncharacterized membrane protein
VATLGATALLLSLGAALGETPRALPFVNGASVLQALAIALLAWLAARVGRARDTLGAVERALGRMATLVANLLLMAWSAEACAELAARLRVAGAVSGSTMPNVFTSVSWLIQAVALLVLGWRSPMGFRRWLGLVLIGVVTLKFVFLDLVRADVFWRFLVALGAGLVMLALSYLYQRRARVEAAGR